jgi:Flp pilus assembly protein TadB
MMDVPIALSILVGSLVGLGIFVGVLTVVGMPRRRAGSPAAFRSRRTSRTKVSTVAIRFALSFLLTLWGTGWIVAAVAIGLLAAYWDRVIGGGTIERVGIARLDALASWTESLRDTIAGAVGLEQAIPATAANAGTAIRPSLNLLVDRLRIREPLPQALLSFADDIDDPSADVICAALVLNARLRGPGLRDVLTALATSAREELDMRRRIEAGRRSIRRSVQIVLLIVLGVMGLLAVFNRTYVQPYSTFTGQIVLLVVVGLLLGGLMWLRKLAMPRQTERFLVMKVADIPAEPVLSR